VEDQHKFQRGAAAAKALTSVAKSALCDGDDDDDDDAPPPALTAADSSDDDESSSDDDDTNDIDCTRPFAHLPSRTGSSSLRPPPTSSTPVVEDQHKFQRGTAAFKSDSKRSEKIYGFGEDYKKDSSFDQVEYISQESIAKAILKPCCAGECLRKKLNTAAGYSCLNFESVFSKVLTARKQLVGNDFKDRVLILKTIIQGY